MKCRRIEFSGHQELVSAGQVSVIEVDLPGRKIECDEIVDMGYLAGVEVEEAVELAMGVPEVEIVG